MWLVALLRVRLCCFLCVCVGGAGDGVDGVARLRERVSAFVLRAGCVLRGFACACACWRLCALARARAG